ncbi:oligosaccharide flippase family protein [Planococcus sp. 11815]|uniref:lipopolysaccharide biosynthesis protein n=1 Tax=Planococcus sp. 11815 TaxID=2939413 RepID=UPI003DA4D6C0
MRKNQMLINLVASILAFIINIGVIFILTPFIVRNIGSEAFGFIALSNNFVIIIGVLTVALNSMASRFISIEINSNRIEGANKYYNSVLISNVILSSLLILPFTFFLVFLNSILNIPNSLIEDVKFTFLFVFINIIIALVGNIFAIGPFTKNRLDLTSIRLIQGNIIRVVILILLFTLFDPKIFFVTLTTAVVTVFTVITNIQYTKKLLPELKFSKDYFSISAIKELLSSGIWNSLNQLSNVLLTQLDLLIANIFITALAAGQFAIVNSINSLILSLISILTMLFVPRFLMIYSKDQRNLANSVKVSMEFTTSLIAIPIGLFLVFGDRFFKLWLPNESESDLYLLLIVSLIALVITSGGNMLANVFTVTNRLKIPSLVMLCTGALKVIIILIILSITDYGLLVIPIVSAIVSILTFILFTIQYAAKCLNEENKFFYTTIIKAILSTSVVIIVSNFIEYFHEVNSWFELFWIFISVTIMSLVFINFFVLSSSSRKEIWKIFFEKSN